MSSQNIESIAGTNTQESTTTATTTAPAPVPAPEAVPEAIESTKESHENDSVKIPLEVSKSSTNKEHVIPTKTSDINCVPEPKEGSRPEAQTTGMVAWSAKNEDEKDQDHQNDQTSTTVAASKRTQQVLEDPNPLGPDLKRSKSDPKKDDSGKIKNEEEKKEEEQPISTKKKFIFGATTKFGAQAFSSTKSSSPDVFSSLPSQSSVVSNVSKEEEPKEKDKVATSTNSSSEPSYVKKNTFGSVFGSKSSFGNAFQAAISKTSIFDTISSKDPVTTTDSNQSKENIEKKDEPKEISTGEENETQKFTCRAKLYSLNLKDIKSGWKERGVGSLHVNQSKDLENIPNRIIMRSNGLMNVILNVKIDEKMQLNKGFEGSLQSAKFITFNGMDGTEVVRYAVKVGKEEVALDLFEVIESLSK